MLTKEQELFIAEILKNMSTNSSPTELDQLKNLIHVTFKEGTRVKFNNKEGIVDRMARDGTVFVWFGEIRETDQAKLVEEIHYSNLEVITN